jgi:hypothetical protein
MPPMGFYNHDLQRRRGRDLVALAPTVWKLRRDCRSH